MKTSHKQKVIRARKLQLQEAMQHDTINMRKLVMRTSIFDTQSWKREKKKIEKRVDQTLANQVLMKAKKENQKGITEAQLGNI